MFSTTNVIDRTNRFYIDMSRKILTTKEYEIIWQMLIRKRPIKDLSAEYGLTYERIRQIYNDAYNKIKSITEVLLEIEDYKKQRDKIRSEYHTEYKQIQMSRGTANSVMLNKRLIDSSFPFSKRFYGMMEYLDIKTIEDLAAIPLSEFKSFRGFKKMCTKELAAFIEFEGVEDLFDGYYKWIKDI